MQWHVAAHHRAVTSCIIHHEARFDFEGFYRRYGKIRRVIMCEFWCVVLHYSPSDCLGGPAEFL